MNTITHEEVAQATARFLASGGRINRLPDTTDLQAAWLRYEELLDGSALNIPVMKEADAAVL